MGTVVLRGGSLLRSHDVRENGELQIDVPGCADVTFNLEPSDFITPGLVDLHCHLSAGGTAPPGLDEEQCLVTGVVGAGDGGSFGPSNIAEAAEQWIDRPSLDVRAWIYLYGKGLRDPAPLPSLEDVVDDLRRAKEAFPRLIVGMKVRLGQGDRDADGALLNAGLAAATELDLRMMVHLTGTYLGAAVVADALRPGDVLSHAFHGREGSIIDRDGHVVDAVRKAQARGALLDVAHGRNHFSWRTFEAAARDGVAPDALSTDINRLSWSRSPVFDLPTVVSKAGVIGMSVEDALRLASYSAASVLGLTLSLDRNVVVLRPEAGPFALADSEGQSRSVPWRLLPIFQLSGGLTGAGKNGRASPLGQTMILRSSALRAV
jgi:dihydroorotase